MTRPRPAWCPKSMGKYTVRLDVGSVLEAPHSCPRCGTPRLAAVPDGERVSFLCRACGLCWQEELGWVHCAEPLSHAPGPSGAHRAPAASPGTGGLPG